MTRLRASMLNTKKAKLSRRKPPSIFKRSCNLLRGLFYACMAVSRGFCFSLDIKKHPAMSGEVCVVSTKGAGLFVIAHEHQQELEHVQEIKIEVQCAKDGGFGEPLLIAMMGVGQILILDILRVIGGETGKYQNTNC
jgi:hypothetical protein